MTRKKTRPYPSYKNPIIIPRFFVSGSAYSVKNQLIEIQKRIITNEKPFSSLSKKGIRTSFQRKNDKIPAL
jgi:hypothetical protein